MPPTTTLTWHDTQITLDANRALFIPEHRTLLIADLHLGKAATFRAHACPVPEAVTQADLNNLSTVLDRYAPDRLIILGDFLHARESLTPATLTAFRQWREAHDLPITLVRGNHDRRAGDPPSDLQITPVDAPHPLGVFMLAHEPPDAPVRPTLAGHLHPGASIRDRHDRLRAPCFVVTPHTIILPAFSVFTGLETYRPGPDDQLFAVGEGAIIPLNVPARR